MPTGPNAYGLCIVPTSANILKFTLPVFSLIRHTYDNLSFPHLLRLLHDPKCNMYNLTPDREVRRCLSSEQPSGKLADTDRSNVFSTGSCAWSSSPAGSRPWTRLNSQPLGEESLVEWARQSLLQWSHLLSFS